MNLLLDTHTFLWYYMGAPNLGRNTFWSKNYVVNQVVNH